MIKESKLRGVFEKKAKSRYLFTKNLVPGKTVYDEKLLRENNTEYREWNPRKSKLAAGILKGLSQIGFKDGYCILYLGASTGTTVSHFSDIVGRNGFIYAVEFSMRSMRDLVFVCEDRKNIAPILLDANNIYLLSERVSMVDFVYQDIAQKNQAEIFLKNIDAFLKKDGFGVLCVKAKSIDISKNPSEIYKEVKKELEKKVTIVDFRTLEPFEKDHCVFVVKNK
ncbi:MAG: fibrillarin-like rRNA/tRNA 2'-O-methyltransferase [Candidatus Woesearchaeota archaeon]